VCGVVGHENDDVVNKQEESIKLGYFRLSSNAFEMRWYVNLLLYRNFTAKCAGERIITRTHQEMR